VAGAERLEEKLFKRRPKIRRGLHSGGARKPLPCSTFNVGHKAQHARRLTSGIKPTASARCFTSSRVSLLLSTRRLTLGKLRPVDVQRSTPQLPPTPTSATSTASPPALLLAVEFNIDLSIVSLSTYSVVDI
jgi:hypothetical protein